MPLPPYPSSNDPELWGTPAALVRAFLVVTAVGSWPAYAIGVWLIVTDKDAWFRGLHGVICILVTWALVVVASLISSRGITAGQKRKTPWLKRCAMSHYMAAIAPFGLMPVLGWLLRR